MTRALTNLFPRTAAASEIVGLVVVLLALMALFGSL